MASEAPDLSRIVNMILANPKLVEEIAAMAKGEGEIPPPPAEESANASEEQEAESLEKSASAPQTAENAAELAPPPKRRERETRDRLVAALKPYLSENRRKAVDSMLGLYDLLEVFKTVT